MEDHAGVRHYLFRLGLDLSSDPRRGARSPAAASRQHAILHCRRRALRMDAAEGHAVPVSPRVACGFGSGGLHLCCRLWLVVLGRATRTFGNCCGHASDDSGFHDAFGNHFSAHAAAYFSAGTGSFDRDRRSVCFSESITEPEFGRSAYRSCWSGRTGHRGDKLVDCFGSHPQAPAARVESHEFRGADAGGGNPARPDGSNFRRVPRISYSGGFSRCLVCACLLDRGRLHRWIYRLRLAHPS